ncbi:MAG: hypothetical protein V9F82_07685 [Dermatophilaceae bacterium]
MAANTHLPGKLPKASGVPNCLSLPGNARHGCTCGENVALDPLDFAAVGQFVLKTTLTWSLVGPEEPLVRGIWDYFQEHEPLETYTGDRPFQSGRRAGRQQGLVQTIYATPQHSDGGLPGV